MRKVTNFIETLDDGPEVELDFEPINDEVLQAKVGDQYVVAYLAQDDSYTNQSIEDHIGEGAGKLYSFHKDAPKGDLQAGRDAMDNDEYAVLLACYSHSGERWSISGEGHQCQWDTSNQAGVWVPGSVLREQLDSEGGTNLRKYCLQFLRTYNSIISGDVYGCVIQRFDEAGEQLGDDSVWGFIGYEYAEQALKTEFFDAACAALRTDYDEAVRTQNGKQLELV